jgi:uncharacterized protein
MIKKSMISGLFYLCKCKFFHRHSLDFICYNGCGENMKEMFLKAAANDVLYFFQTQLNLLETDERGQSLLHYAVRTSAKQVIDYLLDNDIDINIQDKNGETALFDCCKKGKLSIAKQLIRKFANVNLKNFKGEQAIHLAAAKADYDMVKLLLEAGGTLNEKTRDGHSVIHYALKSRQIPFLEYTLKHSNQKFKDVDVFKNTCLHMACEIGAYEVVEYLLKNKHNPNLKNHAKETPLYPAIKSGQTAIVQLLLEHEANPDVHNRFGETPMDYAIVQGQFDIQQIIETHLSGSLYKQHVKKNPLRHAVLIEDLDLLKQGIYEGHHDHKDQYAMSAYDYAHKENLKAFKEMLEKES